MTTPELIIEKYVVQESQEAFSRKVEDLVWEKDITHLDAVYSIMQQQDLEPDNMDKLISKDLYSKVERNAESLSLLKTKTNRVM